MDGSNVDARGASSVICGLCVNVCVNVRVCVCVCESFDAALQQPEPLRDAWFADVQVGPRGTTTRIAGAGIWIREREKNWRPRCFSRCRVDAVTQTRAKILVRDVGCKQQRCRRLWMTGSQASGIDEILGLMQKERIFQRRMKKEREKREVTRVTRATERRERAGGRERVRSCEWLSEEKRRYQ